MSIGYLQLVVGKYQGMMEGIRKLPVFNPVTGSKNHQLYQVRFTIIIVIETNQIFFI